MRRAHDRAAGALVEALRSRGLELRHFAVMIALNARGPLSQSALVQYTGSDKASGLRVSTIPNAPASWNAPTPTATDRRTTRTESSPPPARPDVRRRPKPDRSHGFYIE
jgi:hypothetical protein